MKFFDLEIQAAACLAEDKYTEAIAIYEKCIEANPQVLSNYWKLGLAWILQGQELEGQACWLSAIVEGDAAQVEDWTKELIKVLEVEGLQRLELGKYEQAEKIYLQIIEQNPNYAIGYKNLGNAAFNQGKVEEAIAYYQEGLNLEPNDAITYYHLGVAFHQQDKLEDAIICYQHLLNLNPNDANIMNNLGNAWQRKGQLEEAIIYYQKSLILEPNNALTYNNLGSVFNNQGKSEEALACFQKGLILEPNNIEAHHNLAIFYQEKRQYEQALACCDRAIKIDYNYADVHWTRSLILLRLGDYNCGFIEYEWRWKRKETPPRTLPKPVWDGSNLEGKTILLQAEQGMGDIIQFIRYIPLVIEHGGHVILECHPPLVKLLTTVAGGEKVVAIGETLPEFDVYIPLLSLPRILGTTLATIPAKIPYIYPLESVSFKLDPIPKSCLKVGLVWAGNSSHKDDYKRSCSFNHFLSLLKIPNIAFYSLQKGQKVAEITQNYAQILLQDLSNQLNDFADTAAVIAQLDLVITVDTAVAHLAGAMGKPVWVLLCYNADWRWMIEREDSPWYPTMRLFRQNSPGNWQEVLNRVQQALVKLIELRSLNHLR